MKPKANLKKPLLICCGVCVSVAVVAGAVFAAYRMGAGSRGESEPIVQVIERITPQSPQITGGRGTVLTPDNMRNIDEIMAVNPRATHFTTSMNTNWVFPNGSTQPSSSASVGNSTFNHYTVFFDVVLIETGEVVYASPYLPVGARVEYFALDVDLPQGEHRAIAIFRLVDEDFEELSDIAINVTLFVD